MPVDAARGPRTPVPLFGDQNTSENGRSASPPALHLRNQASQSMPVHAAGAQGPGARNARRPRSRCVINPWCGRVWPSPTGLWCASRPGIFRTTTLDYSVRGGSVHFGKFVSDGGAMAVWSRGGCGRSPLSAEWCAHQGPLPVCEVEARGGTVRSYSYCHTFWRKLQTNPTGRMRMLCFAHRV